MMDDLCTRENHRSFSNSLIVANQSYISQLVYLINANFGAPIEYNLGKIPPPPHQISSFIGRCRQDSIPDNAKITANEPYKGRFDFVFCTYQFIENCFRAWEANTTSYEIVETIGLSQTLTRVANYEQLDRKRHHINALFSSVHRELDLSMKYVALDEAKFVKSPWFAHTRP